MTNCFQFCINFALKFNVRRYSVELVELVLREAREGGGRSDTSLAREIDTFLATHRPREQGD
jgi:hypothetical protein